MSHPIDIDHVAHLARLDLAPHERTTLGPQLADIIGYVDQLSALDTASIEATFQVLPLSNVTRSDVLGLTLPPEEALANAPQREDGYFRVPRIL